MAPPLVWINGFPGAGKLTVARALFHMIGPDRAVLIDNHQLIDAVAVRMSRDHPEYQAARRLERNRVFTEMAEKSDDHCKVFIFTGKTPNISWLDDPSKTTDRFSIGR